VTTRAPARPSGAPSLAGGRPEAGRQEGDSAKARPVLTASTVSMAFGGVQALAGVSFEVRPRESLGIIGPNGAGKTTLFNCVSGLHRPDGRLVFEGHDLTRLKPSQIARLGVARTFQNLELFRHMTTLDNLLLGRHLHFRSGLIAAALAAPSWRRQEILHRERVERILGLLDLQSVRDRFVVGLSYGQQKLVELGRALALEPKLLMLDEPSAGMTAEEKDELIDRVRDIRAEFDLAILLVEHDLRLVGDLADRVLVLDHGQVIAGGTLDQVRNDPAVIRAYLGKEAAA